MNLKQAFKFYNKDLSDWIGAFSWMIVGLLIYYLTLSVAYAFGVYLFGIIGSELYNLRKLKEKELEKYLK